jgi:TM2 domain-containing membrane protein YozV
VSSAGALSEPYHPRRHAPHIRATDVEREAVAAMIRASAEDGRLRLDEIDERLDAVYEAKTHGELAEVVADIVPVPPRRLEPAYLARPAAGVSDRTILPAFLLCFFLGIFSAHRFYAGNTKSGVVNLLLFFPTAGIVPTIWMFVDLIVLVVGSYKDGDGNVLRDWT